MLMDYKKFGMRLRQERLNQRLTQEKLAEKADLSAVYISQIEHGNRKLSLDTLVKLAKHLNVSVDSLIQDSIYESNEQLVSELRMLMQGCSQTECLLILDIIRCIRLHFGKTEQ